MPYIKKYKRDDLNDYLDILGHNIETEGELNYAITMLCKKFIEKQGESYSTYNTVVGVLSCAQMELYRRMIAEYENKKIRENGDVFETPERVVAVG
jgi:hypothetical protein